MKFFDIIGYVPKSSMPRNNRNNRNSRNLITNGTNITNKLDKESNYKKNEKDDNKNSVNDIKNDKENKENNNKDNRDIIGVSLFDATSWNVGDFKTYVSIPLINIKPEDFMNLLFLKLDNTDMHDFPRTIEKFKNLERVDVSNNKLTYIYLTSPLEKLYYINLKNNKITTIYSLSQCKNIKNIKASNNSISMVHDNIFSMDKLEKLNLSHNSIVNLPYNTSYVYNNLVSKNWDNLNLLKKLNLSHNKITSIENLLNKPPPNLEKLLLNNNCIREVKTLKNFKNLLLLDLSNNEIVNLPDDMDNLKSIKEINLSCNKIKVLPSTLIELDKSIYVNIRCNDINSFNTSKLTDSKYDTTNNSINSNINNNININNSININDNINTNNNSDINNNRIKNGMNNNNTIITDLDYKEYNSIDKSSLSLFDKQYWDYQDIVEYTKIPKSMIKKDDYINLLILKINDNSITNFPDIHDFKNLQYVDISNNNITHVYIPCSMDNLYYINLNNNKLMTIYNLINCKNIKNIKANNNSIKHINSNIFDLKKLEKLDLSKNDINNLPLIPSYIKCNNWSCLTFLKKLDLSHNKLVYIENFLSFPPNNLEKLYLNNNSIKEIKTLKNLTKLKVLNISSNQITSLPDDTEYLQNIEIFDVSNNRLKELPKTVNKLNITLITLGNLLD